MAVPTWFWWDQAKTDPVIDVATLNNVVDFIDLMEYGMQNTTQISYYSPVYQNPEVNQETWNLRGINEWKQAGVDSSKLITLIPFESLQMTDNNAVLPVAVGHIGGRSQWIGLRDIPSTVTMHWDDIAKANWGEQGNTFYSFENQTSITEKVQYARNQHIGGVGIWELWRGWLPNASAGHQDPLLQALKNAVASSNR